jgi:MFS family permease
MQPERTLSPMALLLSGVAALIVAMGIGRFAYTPILPLMKNGAGLTDTMAGIIASSNYVGYLAGALWASLPMWHKRRVVTIRWALVVGSVTTLAMAFSQNIAVWLVLRCVSGIASAFILILVSSVILDHAARHRITWWPGVLYAGVGIGIAFTGVVVPAFGHAGWRAAWIGLGVLSLIVTAVIAGRFRNEDHSVQRVSVETGETRSPLYWGLVAGYFAEGLGYVIPATFIVAILRETPGLAPFAPWSWVIVGIVAAPSAILWNRLGAAFGRVVMIVVALLVLALGVITPAYVHTVAGAAFSAFALGLTFMGITALVNTEARELFPRGSNRAIGELTAAFGVGQIIGPLVVSAFAASGGSYNASLVTASIVLAAGAAATAIGRFATLPRVAQHP